MREDCNNLSRSRLNLNDLPAFLKMNNLQLSWLKQELPNWFNPRAGRYEWNACVSTFQKEKGRGVPRYEWGYGDTPEEALLDAVDNWKKPRAIPLRAQPIGLEDLEIEL